MSTLPASPDQNPSTPNARRPTIENFKRRSTIRRIIRVTREGAKELRV
jgi:hypothetical protein